MLKSIASATSAATQLVQLHPHKQQPHLMLLRRSGFAGRRPSCTRGCGGACTRPIACANRRVSRLPVPLYSSRSFACSCSRSSRPGCVELNFTTPASALFALSAARNPRSPAGSYPARAAYWNPTLSDAISSLRLNPLMRVCSITPSTMTPIRPTNGADCENEDPAICAPRVNKALRF